MAKVIKSAVIAASAVFVTIAIVASGGTLSPLFTSGALAFGGSTAAFAIAAQYAVVTLVGSIVAGGIGMLTSRGISASRQNFGTKIAGRGAQVPRQIVYGECRVGGTIVKMHTSGTKNNKLHLAIVLAGHEIESLEGVYFNDTLLTTTSSTISGETVYRVSNAKFKNDENENAITSGGVLVQYTFHDGSQTDVDGLASANASSRYPSTAKFQGMAYVYMEVVYDPEKIPGLPPIHFRVKGKKVYDPRNSTTAFSSNPALIIRDYLTDTTYGLRALSSEINDTTAGGGFAAAANACDADVTLADNVTTEDRFTLNGFVNASSAGDAVLESFLSSCAGKLTHTNGKFNLFVGTAQTPSLTIEDDDVLDTQQLSTKSGGGDLFNGIKALYVDKEQNYQGAETPILVDSTYLSEDTPSGEQSANYKKILETQLPFTVTHTGAQRLQKIQLKRHRESATLSLLTTLEFMKLQPGDWVNVTNARLSYSAKTFEVLSTQMEFAENEGVVYAATRLTLQEASAGIYDYVYSEYSTPQTTGSTPPGGDLSVGSPTAGTLSQRTRPEGPAAKIDIIASWTNASEAHIQGTEIQYREDGETAYDVATLAGRGATTAVISNVQVGKTYDVRIRHFSWDNVYGAFVNYSQVTIAEPDTLAAPGNPAATTDKPFFIELTWTNPSNANFRAVEVHYSTSSGFTPDSNTLLNTYYGEPAKQKKVILGVSAGLSYDTNYYFKLRSVNVYGTTSGYTSQATGQFKKAQDADVENLSANSITAGTIDASTVTVSNIDAGNISTGTLDSNRVNAGQIVVGGLESGVTIDAGSLTMSAGGHIKGGQTGYNDTNNSGFFLGYDTDAYKFSIGSNATKSLTFDGDDLTIGGSVNIGSTAASTVESNASAGNQVSEQSSLLPRADDSEWVVGDYTSKMGIWVENGADENEVLLAQGPHGDIVKVWKATSTDGSDADGGFFNQFSDAWDIEDDTVYRLSVFVKQSNTNGNFYFGAYNFTSGGSNVNLYKHDGTGGTTNKYWQNGGDLPTQGDWYLAVGYINPSDTNISGGKGGLYDVKSGEKKSNYDDWRFSGAGSESDAAKFIFRTYQFYAVSSPTAIMEWAHPRVDRMDRRAPSIAELLRGWTDLAAPIEEGVTITGGGITLSDGGAIKGGQSAFDTGTGFFLGYDSAYKFSIGNASGRKLTWNGSVLAVDGEITANSLTLATGVTSVTDPNDVVQNTNNNAFFRYETTAANDAVAAPTDAQFNTAFGRNPRTRDVVIVVNTASDPDVSAAYIYNGSSWDAKNDFLTGDLIVDGTIKAANIDVNDLVTSGSLLTGTATISNDIRIGSGDSVFSADSAGIYLGSETFSSAEFRVTPAGAMTATGATITGGSVSNSTTIGGTAASTVLSGAAAGATAVQDDTMFSAKIAWGYDEDVQGWAGTNLTATHNNEGYVNLASTTSDPQWSLSSQSIDGRKDHIVRVRIKRTAGTSWQGTLYYSTSGHGFFSESYRKTITDSTVTNQWVVLEYDMSSLTAGGTDWTSNTITGLRFDWGNSSSDTFQIDWIAVGSVGSTPVREGGDVISGSVGGISIDSSKLYAGTGTWQNANTGFYLDDTGKFSLKDKLFFDPSNNLLTVDGNITADVITAKQNLVVLGDLEASSVAVGSITRAMLAQSALDEIFGSLATSVGGSNGDFKEGTGSFTTSGGSVTLGTSSDKFDHGTASVDVEFHINTYFYSTTNYTTAQAQATLTFEATADGTFNDLNSADKTHTLQFLEYDLSSYYGYTYLVYYLNTAITKTFTSGSGNDLADNVDVQFRVAVSGVGSAFTGQTLSFEASANEGVTGVTSTGGNADTLDNLDSTAFLRSNVDDTFDGTLTITGDLILQGGIDQYNVTNLDVTDKTITVNNGGTQSLSDGAGLIIDRGTAADASITWDETGDKFDFTNQIAAPSLQIGTTLQEVITSARVLQNVTANAAILTSGTLPSARLGGDVWKNRGSISVTTTSDGSQHNPFDDAHSETKVAGYGSYRLDYTGATAHMISSAVGGSASVFQIGAHYNGDDFYMRVRTDSSNWKNWRKLFHDNYHPNADKWTNARTVSLTGFVTGSFSLDGTADATLATTASIDVPRTFTLPNTASNTNQWIYIGRATGLGQHGASVSIRLRLSNGYNASNAQNVEGYIRFKTSNASSNQSGFYGDAQLYRFGQNVNALQELKVVQASNSTSEYQFYILASSFTGEHSNYTVEQSSGAWTHVGTFSGSAPTGTLITESPRRIFTSGFAQNDNLDLGTGTATANGFNVGVNNVISSARGLSVSAITNTGLMSTKTITVTPQDNTNEGGEIVLAGAGTNEAIHIDNHASLLRIFDGSAPTVRFSINSSGNATFAGTITGTSVHSTGNSTFDQITLKPTSGSGTGGGRVLDVHYTGDDRLAVISTDQSSGSLTIGYGAESGNVGAQSFKSTFDNFSGKRSAVTFRNDSVKFWGTNANVQTAVGSALQTMVNRITLHTDDGSAEFDGGITADGPSVFNPTNDMIVVNEPSTNTDLQTVMRVGTSAGGLYLTTNNAIIGKGAYYDGQWIATDTTGAHIDFTGSNRITFSTFSGATVGGTAAFGSRAYIDSNGLNVTGHIGGGSGHIVGKFAVKSTGVHASYDLYNNGTSYFNGAVTVDDTLYISGTNGRIRFGNTEVIDPNRVVKNIARLEFSPFTVTGTSTSSAATIRYGNIAANVEGSHMSHPYFFNDLGNFENRGGVITTGGLNFTPSYTNCFRPNPNFASWGNSNYTGSTMTITLTNLPKGLNYSGYIGIAFGNTSWCPSSCKIEVSTNGGSTWTTRLNDTSAKELYFTSTGTGGTPLNAIRFTLGQAANTTSIRVTNIWAYNYNSSGMDNYFLDKAGGTLGGQLQIEHSSGNNTIIGDDGTYGVSGSGRYVSIGFGGNANGANRIFAHNTGQDHLYIAAATGRGVIIRTNGGGGNTFAFTSGGAFQVAGTTVVDASRNVTAVGLNNTGLISNIRTSAFSPNDSGAGLRLEYSGGDASGSIGSGIVFAQRWWSNATSNVRTGGIAGFKGAGSGSFGGGLKFYTQPGSGADMNVALTLDRNTNAQFAGTISSGTHFITSTGGATNALSIVNSGANGGYFNVSSNVGGVSTDGSVGLHIGWNKSNGGREINMIFDGGTAQTDTEMIFTSTDGSTYSDIFQINGGGNVDIKSGGLRIGTTTAIDSNRRFYASDGSAGAPAFSFSADTDTGFYRYTTNQIGFAISGSHRGTIDFHALRHFGREYQLAEKEVMRSQALAAPSNTTQRHRRTILEVSYNSHHWMQVGVFKIRVETTYPIGNEYAEYLMHVGYLHTSTAGSQGGSGTSVNDWVISRVFSSKVSGNYDHELIVGTPTDTGFDSGGYDIYKVPIYLENDHYAQHRVTIEAPQDTFTRVTSFSGQNQFIFMPSYTATVLTGQVVNPLPNTQAIYGILYGHTKYDRSTTLTNGTGYYVSPSETNISGRLAGTLIAGSGFSPTGSTIGGVRAYGNTGAYMGASDQAGRTAFYGVDSSGYAMFGALTNHDAVIRANNVERIRARTNGNINFQNGGLEIGGTTVIDSSRNLTNIGTISSGAITTITGAITVKYGATNNISLTPTASGGVINARNSSGTSVVAMDARGTPFLDVTGNLKTGGTTRIDSSGNVYANYNTLGTSIRSSGRGELHLNATSANGVSEIFFGYGSGYAGNDNNIRWGISDRGASTGKLVFYKGPKLTGSSFYEVAYFSNASNRLHVATGYGVAGTTVIDSARNGSFANIINSNGAKIEIQGGTDGGNGRGIFMWDSSDSNWGIYMATSGSGKSLAGGTAPAALDGATQHHVRFRCYNQSSRGWIFENSSEQARASINANTGNFLTVGNVTAYASDERLKENITPIADPIEKIKRLQGVEFDWKSDCEDKGFIPSFSHETGVIAQNIAEVVPDAVSPAPFDNDYLTVDKSKLVAVLIEAVKAQQDTIESLTKRIEELENGDN